MGYRPYGPLGTIQVAAGRNVSNGGRPALRSTDAAYKEGSAWAPDGRPSLPSPFPTLLYRHQRCIR